MCSSKPQWESILVPSTKDRPSPDSGAWANHEEGQEMAMSRSFMLIGAAVAAAVVGCGNGPSKSAAPQASPSVARSTDKMQLAAAVGPAILTITPAAGAKPVIADFAALDAVATVDYDIYEPFEEKRVAFKGVELSDLLDAAGVPASATSVRMVALDDYLIDLKMSDVRAGGVILATRADGELITIAKGGPVRIVFRDGLELGKNTDRWIWSLTRIDLS